VEFLDAGHDIGVEVLRFGAVGEVQDLSAIAGFDEALAFAAPREERKYGEHAEAKDQPARREYAGYKLHRVFDN
jgi:hypothetical protein